MNIQYPAQDSISIWIGVFPAENDFNWIVDRTIEPSLNLTEPLSSICEVAFEAESIPIRELLEGFSGWATFIDAACEAASENGVSEANGALVCYYLRCEAAPTRWPGILYLGTFRGQDVKSDNQT